MATKKSAPAPAPETESKPLGRPALPDDLKRTGRLSMRTYPEIVAKYKRVGTVAVEEAIMAIKEPGVDAPPPADKVRIAELEAELKRLRRAGSKLRDPVMALLGILDESDG